jgi:hypothetical protein
MILNLIYSSEYSVVKLFILRNPRGASAKQRVTLIVYILYKHKKELIRRFERNLGSFLKLIFFKFYLKINA